MTAWWQQQFEPAKAHLPHFGGKPTASVQDKRFLQMMSSFVETKGGVDTTSSNFYLRKRNAESSPQRTEGALIEEKVQKDLQKLGQKTS